MTDLISSNTTLEIWLVKIILKATNVKKIIQQVMLPRKT